WHHFGPDLPAVAPTHAVVLGAINHGRSASCDGYLDFAEGVQPQRARFSHVFTFTSMVKTAKVKEIRTYLVEESMGTGCANVLPGTIWQISWHAIQYLVTLP